MSVVLVEQVVYGSLTISHNVDPGICHRLVHKGANTDVVSLIKDTSGITRTIFTLYCATEMSEIEAEISRLNLNYTPPETLMVVEPAEEPAE